MNPIPLIVAALMLLTPAASPSVGTPTPLIGLSQMLGRQYAPNPDQPLSQDEPVLLVSIKLLRFDTPAHATAAYPAFANTTGLADQLPLDSGRATRSDTDLLTPGDQAHVTTIAATNEQGETGYFRMMTLRSRETIALITVIASQEPALAIADDMASQIVDTPTSNDNAQFAADGSSRGGLWSRFPANGDPVLRGLIPFVDTVYDIPTAP